MASAAASSAPRASAEGARVAVEDETLKGAPDVCNGRSRLRPSYGKLQLPSPLFLATDPCEEESAMQQIDTHTMTELEAAAFRKLVDHLRKRIDVQNIDLMNLAGFCRNCLSNWLEEAAAERSVKLDRAEARRHVYGMPYEEWKQRYQKEATPEQKAAFESAHRHS